MVDFADFYRGKSVFVTGHTGFKGAWLALWLTSLGAHVHGYGLQPPTTPSLFEETKLAGSLASHTIGDVRDFELLGRTIKKIQPQIVLHLAAQPLVRLSYRQPRETYETNVMGTVNLLEAVRQAGGVKVCQIVTSDKCYENREWVYAYRENDPMGGFDPYSSSKGCAELVTAAWRRSYFNPADIARHGTSLASARAGNVIGGGDWAEDRIIPDCIRALQKKESILVRNPHAIRPWQHVLEPLCGYLTLAAAQWNEPVIHADAYNFGPHASGNLTVGQIAEKAVAGWGSGTWHTPSTAPADVVHEATFLKLDVTKSATLLHWRPRFSVNESIDQTVAWYRRRFTDGSAFDAAGMCLKQIQSYQTKSPETAGVNEDGH